MSRTPLRGLLGRLKNDRRGAPEQIDRHWVRRDPLLDLTWPPWDDVAVDLDHHSMDRPGDCPHGETGARLMAQHIAHDQYGEGQRTWEVTSEVSHEGLLVADSEPRSYL